MAVRSSTVAYPLLALCCLGVILFAVAATIVLALIPVYLSTRTLTPTTFQNQLTFALPVASTVPLGTLSGSALAPVTTLLQSSQNGGTVNVTSAQVVNGTVTASGRKRRQDSGNTLLLGVHITGRTRSILKSLERQLTKFVDENPSSIVAEVVAIINNLLSTTTATTVSSAELSSTTTVSSTVLSLTTTTTVSSTVITSITTTTIPSGVLSSTTTTIPSGVLSSTTTIPSGALSSTVAPAGRRRRQIYEKPLTMPPSVTYKD